MQEEREGAKREMNDAVSHSRSNARMSVCLSCFSPMRPCEVCQTQTVGMNSSGQALTLLPE